MAGNPAMLSRAARAEKYSILDRPGWEVLNWSYYDYQVYAAAGQTVLTFFQTPKGQGGRTLRDTNFPGAGALPSGYEFFVQSFSVLFIPGVAPAANPPRGAPTVADFDFVRDVWTVHNDGFAVFRLLNKNLIEGGPIGIFPPDWRLMGFAAASDASTAAADLLTVYNYAASGGKVWRMNNQLIESTVSFDVSLNWNAALALPSATAARIGVYLNGALRRKIQ